MPESINKLYQAVLNHEQGAEDNLFEALSARFRLFARQRIWNKEDSEEIVQNAVMTIAQDYKTIEITSSFSAWAYKILDNRILTYIQKRKTEAQRMTSLNPGNPDNSTDNLDTNVHLENKLSNCFRKITKKNIRYARILNFHYQGFSTDEICEKLDITPTNMYSILCRARSLLQECLEKGNNKP